MIFKFDSNTPFTGVFLKQYTVSGTSGTITICGPYYYLRGTCDWCGKMEILDDENDYEDFIPFRDKLGWVGMIDCDVVRHFCSRECRYNYSELDSDGDLITETLRDHIGKGVVLIVKGNASSESHIPLRIDEVDGGFVRGAQTYDGVKSIIRIRDVTGLSFGRPREDEPRPKPPEDVARRTRCRDPFCPLVGSPHTINVCGG